MSRAQMIMIALKAAAGGNHTVAIDPVAVFGSAGLFESITTYATAIVTGGTGPFTYLWEKDPNYIDWDFVIGNQFGAQASQQSGNSGGSSSTTEGHKVTVTDTGNNNYTTVSYVEVTHTYFAG